MRTTLGTFELIKKRSIQTDTIIQSEQIDKLFRLIENISSDFNSKINKLTAQFESSKISSNLPTSQHSEADKNDFESHKPKFTKI